MHWIFFFLLAFFDLRVCGGDEASGQCKCLCVPQNNNEKRNLNNPRLQKIHKIISQLVSVAFAESQGQIKIHTHPEFAITEVQTRKVWDALHYAYKWTWIIHAHVSQGLLSICVKAPSKVSESSGKGMTSRLHAYWFFIKRCETKKPPVAGSGAIWFHTSMSPPQVITEHPALASSTCHQSSKNFVFLNCKTDAATWHYGKFKCPLMKPTDIIYPSSKNLQRSRH